MAAVLRGRGGAGAAPAAAAPSPSDAVSRRVLDVMDPAVVVLGADDAVLLANPSARELGVVRGTRLAVPALVELAHGVRGGGRGRADVRLSDEVSGEAPRQLGAHAVPLEQGPAAPVA